MKNNNTFGGTAVKVKVSCLCLHKANHATTVRSGKNLIRILQSFAMLPVIALSVPFGGITSVNTPSTPIVTLAANKQPSLGFTGITQSLGLTKKAELVITKAEEAEVQMLDLQGAAIDAYFKARKMPLEGTGRKMAEEAFKNGIDWRLIPAISVRESTGGKFACKSVPHSYFGWGSCKIGFKSKDAAIESLARNLSGNNPNTDHHYPKGQTTKKILQRYNPPSIVPNYANEVMNIMDVIGTKDLGVPVETIAAEISA